MKTKTRRLHPTCDICKDTDAEYDAPTVWGPWANMCKKCYFEKGNHQLAEQVGTKYIKTEIIMNGKGKTVNGIEDWDNDEYVKHLMADGNREVTCPICEEVRELEVDASGTYECDCGATVRIPVGVI